MIPTPGTARARRRGPCPSHKAGPRPTRRDPMPAIGAARPYDPFSGRETICSPRPGADAPAMPDPTTPAPAELRPALRSLRGALTTVAIFSGFLNLLMLAPSLYMMQVYDRVLASRNETTLWLLTGLVLGTYLFMGLLESIRGRVLVRVGARLDATLSARVFQATFDRTLARAGSNSAQPLNDLNALRQT